MFVTADEWIKIDLFFGVCDLDDGTPDVVDCIVDIEPFIDTGEQFQLAVESVAAHNRSGLSEPSDPILVVGPATPPGVRDALRQRGWYVVEKGAPIRVKWGPATYKVDDVDVPVPRYEFFKMAVGRLGPCSVPSIVSVEQ